MIQDFAGKARLGPTSLGHELGMSFMTRPFRLIDLRILRRGTPRSRQLRRYCWSTSDPGTSVPESEEEAAETRCSGSMSSWNPGIAKAALSACLAVLAVRFSSFSLARITFSGSPSGSMPCLRGGNISTHFLRSSWSAFFQRLSVTSSSLYRRLGSLLKKTRTPHLSTGYLLPNRSLLYIPR